MPIKDPSPCDQRCRFWTISGGVGGGEGNCHYIDVCIYVRLVTKISGVNFVRQNQCENKTEIRKKVTKNCNKYKWDAASSCRLMGTSRQNPLLSYLVFCFLILPVWDDFSFCLHSWHGKFWRFDHFPWILEGCFSFLCFLECVCLGGGGCWWAECFVFQNSIKRSENILEFA